MTGMLEQTMSSSKTQLINMTNQEWQSYTPLDNWSTPSLAIILQGSYPAKLVLPAEAYAEAKASGVVRIAPWESGFQSKWFKLPDTRHR